MPSDEQLQELAKAAVAKLRNDPGYSLPPLPCEVQQVIVDTLRTLRAQVLREAAEQRSGIYIASKTQHASKWKALRAAGVPVISTWIDEAGIGETKCFADLWTRCVTEASRAAVLIVYSESETLKGALVEVGAALASGVPVYVVGECDGLKSAKSHPLVTPYPTMDDAVAAALRAQAEEEQ